MKFLAALIFALSTLLSGRYAWRTGLTSAVSWGSHVYEGSDIPASSDAEENSSSALREKSWAKCEGLNGYFS